MSNKANKSLKYLVFISQVAITMLTPLALCMMAALWIRKRYPVGQWIVLAGILIGLAAGFLNVYKLMIRAIGKK